MRLLLPALFLLSACASAPRGEAPPAVSGTYALTQINGQDLPVYVGSYEGCREYAQAGTLDLAPDGRYSFTATMREACAPDSELEGGVSEERETGTYTVDGATVRLAEEARERAAFNRWEGAGGGPGRDIPIEDLGGTARYEDGRLTVALSQGDATATFRLR